LLITKEINDIFKNEIQQKIIQGHEGFFRHFRYNEGIHGGQLLTLFSGILGTQRNDYKDKIKYQCCFSGKYDTSNPRHWSGRCFLILTTSSSFHLFDPEEFALLLHISFLSLN